MSSQFGRKVFDYFHCCFNSRKMVMASSFYLKTTWPICHLWPVHMFSWFTGGFKNY